MIEAPPATRLAVDIAFLGRYGNMTRGEVRAMTIRQFQRALQAVNLWLSRENGDG